jgi:hypothetical protein
MKTDQQITFNNLHDIADLAYLTQSETGIKSLTDAFVKFHNARLSQMGENGQRPDFPKDPRRAALQILTQTAAFNLCGCLASAIAMVEKFEVPLNAGRAKAVATVKADKLPTPQDAFMCASYRMQAMLEHSATEYGGRGGIDTHKMQIADKVVTVADLLSPMVAMLEAIFPHRIGRAAVIALADEKSPYQPGVERWMKYLLAHTGDAMKELTHEAAMADSEDEARELIAQLPRSISELYSEAMMMGSQQTESASEVMGAILAELNKRATEPAPVA